MVDDGLRKVQTKAHFADGKTKDFFKVGRLADEQEVECPTAAKVGHNDGIHRHGGEELSPWSLEFLLRIDTVNLENNVHLFKTSKMDLYCN